MEVDDLPEYVDEQLSTCMDTSLTFEVEVDTSMTIEEEDKQWFCEVCDRKVPADELESHFMYHPVYMYPSMRDNEALKVVEYEDSYNEIAGLLGKILRKFRKATTLKDEEPIKPKEHKSHNHHHHQKEKPKVKNGSPSLSKDSRMDNSDRNEQKSHHHKHKKLDMNLSPVSLNLADKRKLVVEQDNELDRNRDVLVPPKKKKIHEELSSILPSSKELTKKFKESTFLFNSTSPSALKEIKIKKSKESTLSSGFSTTSSSSSKDILKIKKPKDSTTVASTSCPNESLRIKKPKEPTVSANKGSPSSSTETLKIKKPKESKFSVNNASPSSSKEIKLKKSKEEDKGKGKSDDDKKYFIMNSANPYKSKKVQETVDMMIRKMRKLKMKVRDLDTLNQLDGAMKTTFDYRKHEVQIVQMGIADTLAIFPAMTDYRILKTEFERLRSIDLKELDSKLQNDLMVEHQRFRTKYYIAPVTCIEEVIEALRKEEDHDLRRDLEMLCLGYQKTQSKFCNKLFKQRKTEQEEPFRGITPTIDILGDLFSDSKKITVYCEQQKICRCPNFYEAVMCAYAMYWIFNLCYEKGAEKLFERFDQLIGE